jgi:hypothetical protein
MKMLDFVLVSVIFCINAAWLFWKRDVGRYRSRFQNRHKKKTLTNQRRSANVFPTTWRYEMFPQIRIYFFQKLLEVNHE